MNFSRFLRVYALTLLPVVALAYIVAESYQIDYRAFHVAGKSILLGLDPYLNYVNTYPELYSPINAENSAFSAFRYPPLAAFFFAPFALFSYEGSRILFSLVILIALYILAWLLLRDREVNSATILSVSLVILSLPIAATFQRGQVDIILVALACWQFECLQQRKTSTYASLLLAIATITKIFPGFLSIYLLLKRKFREFFIFCTATIFLYFLPLSILSQTVFFNFWKRTFPRIFGEIVSSTPISTHDQKAVFVGSGNYISAIEGLGKVAERDYVGGKMNFLLGSQDLLAIVVGCLAFVGIFYLLKKEDDRYQFLSLINTINIFNPLSWLMGVNLVYSLLSVLFSSSL